MSSDYKNLIGFTAELRAIPDLYLYNIFTSYHTITNRDLLFDILAANESKKDVAELERLWEEFLIKKQD